ncbi:uncharacterized protein LOC111360590 [Spodoptera litura]|uniref:Uncharacterized protein LOC111360590 n=1 Tax=Spodoptera litura TaxID=69820 RepID=A0A9J7J155_SPOLT|nr:uncharacterized protein LOC111360590 [Spodoptera litura]
MDKNSEEELFDDVVTGLKEQGLVSVNFSRKKRSEFVYESQSQESFQKSPSFSESQFYTYEVNKNGEMLLLEKSSKSDRLENVLLEDSQACRPVFSAEQSCQDNGGTGTGSSLTVLNDITPLSFLNQPQIPPSPGHNSENVIESIVEIIPDAESPTILNSYDFEIGTFHVVEETRNDTDSPTILNSYDFNLEPELSTSFVVPTSSRICDDHNFDPDQTSCSSEDDDSGMNEGNSTGRKTKKRKGLAEAEHWKARMNKKLREQGKDYIGWRRNENSCNTHNAPRAAKTLKETCRSAFCRSSKERHCHEFTSECRQRLFDLFWNLSWDQKKMFVINTTDKIIPLRPKENTRRGASLQYYLKQGDVKLRVCKKMYLNTLGIGEWSVRSWVNKSECGMFAKENPEQIEKKKRGEKKRLSREFLVEFIENLPQLPSHYCRKDTSKTYLEPIPGGMVEVYRTYTEASTTKNLIPLCRTMFDNIIKEKNIGFQQPKKDLCDTCLSYHTKQISEQEYKDHQLRKQNAREEKEKDLKEAGEGKCVVLEQDVQAVKVCPYIRASSAYYRRKLINHNFTVYEYPSKKVRCYWFSEVDCDTQASVFVSCILDYLHDMICDSEGEFETKPIIIWSDGCTYQNRNAVLANALSNFAGVHNVVIYQKYLEPGHTQMEVDSVHAAIERAIKKYDAIYVPSQYADITKKSRKDPYDVKMVKYDFFKKFDDTKVMRYDSIRPGKKKGDPVVTDLKVLLYHPDGKIYYKTNICNENYSLLPSRPKKINFPISTYEQLFKDSPKLTSCKFNDLQALKTVIPSDYYSFYDNLPHM